MYQALMLPEKVVVRFKTKSLYEKCHAIAYFQFSKMFSPITGHYDPNAHPFEHYLFKNADEFKRHLLRQK